MPVALLAGLEGTETGPALITGLDSAFSFLFRAVDANMALIRTAGRTAPGDLSLIVIASSMAAGPDQTTQSLTQRVITPPPY